MLHRLCAKTHLDCGGVLFLLKVDVAHVDTQPPGMWELLVLHDGCKSTNPEVWRESFRGEKVTSSTPPRRSTNAMSESN